MYFFKLADTTEVFAQSNWYNSNWTNRVKLTVDNTKVPNTDQTDFPIYIDLSDLPSSFFSSVKSDGSDIVVTSSDGLTKLSRELVDIDTGASTGELWFKAPILSASSDTDFYIYYGNSGAGEINDTSVWSNGYKMVQHMSEDPSGTAPQLIDSTVNNKNGTTSGSMLSGDLVGGQVGNALNFDGVDNLISLGNNAFGNIGDQVTISVWIKTSSDGIILSEYESTVCGDVYFSVGKVGNPSIIDFHDGASQRIITTETVVDNNWHYITAISDVTASRIYIDGVLKASSTDVDWRNTCSSQDVRIGARDNSTVNTFDGLIDEFKITNTSKSSDWIATEYNNQSSPSTFYNTNTEESFTSGWYNSSWSSRQKVTIKASEVPNTDQMDFPVYVDLEDVGTGLFQNGKSDGSDLVVTMADGLSKLKREIVSYDNTNDTGELWFKAPVLSSSEDTVFYIYYGNDLATETNDTDVWSNGYVMVQHMNDNPDSSSTQDSTSSNHDGTKAGAAEPIEATGNLNKSQNFDGTNDAITFNNGSIIGNNTTGSISLWVRSNTTTLTTEDALYDESDSGGTVFRIRRQTDNRIGFDARSSGGVWSTLQTTDPLIWDNTWHYITVNWDDITGKKIYINGLIDNSAITFGSTDRAVVNAYAGRYGQGFYFDGDLDDMKITNEERSTDWIATEYNNQSDPDNFYEVEVIETEDPTIQWYDQNWNFRQKITIDNAKISTSNQYHFPVYIDLSDMNFGFFSSVETDGSDIVVTMNDGVTKLKRELVDIDTGGSTGELWFKAPVLSVNADTSFYIYYDNSSATEANSSNVWVDEYQVVQHANEDPSGSAPQMTDSTSHSNNGTSNGSMTTDDIEIGQLGNSIDYDASNDYIDYGTGINGAGNKFTVSAWINPDNLVSGQEYHILDNGNGYLPNVGSGGSFALTTYNSSSTHKVYLYIMNSSGVLASANGPVGGQISSGTWSYVTGVYNGTDIKVYIDGIERASNTHSGQLDTVVSNLVSGRGLGGSQYYLNGNIDEVRLSGKAHTVDWIVTEYNNQSDTSTFYTIGAENSRGVCPATDGGINDDDSTIDGVITIQSNQTWTAEESAFG